MEELWRMRRMIEIKKILLIVILLFIFTPSLSALLTPALTFNISPNPIVSFPGTDGYIYINLKNVGNDYAQDIKVVAINIDPGIVLPYDNEIKIGNLAPGDSTIVLLKYSVPNSIESGLYRVKIKIEYCQESSCKDIYQYALINVQSPSALRVKSISPTEIKVGNSETLYLTISNEGNSEAKNIFITIRDFSGNLLTFGSDNKYYIEKLSPKEEKIITFNVSVSSLANPGLYPVYIYVEYTDKSNSRILINSSFGLRIREDIDFFVGTQEVSGNLVTFSIGNIGLSTAYSVVLEIPSQPNFYSSEPLVFIGNINPGDYTSVSLNIYPTRINENETKYNNTLKIYLYYTNEKGEREKLEKIIKINLERNITSTYFTPRFQQKSQTEPFYYFNYIIAISIIISLILLLYKLKKGKKK
ncbi:MAG: hypothetical protein QXL14_01035 [Candidatus Aenigmatarchaeota archaeon]